MKKNLFLSLISAIFPFFFISTVFAQPSEQNLISAWESLQKADPKTVVFEKLAERHYKFKTELFPFDGELKITNIVIDKNFDDFEYSTSENVISQGIVEVELVGISEDFLHNHGYSYGLWARNNILYYDEKEKQWVPLSKALQKYRQPYKPAVGICYKLSGLISTLIFLVIFFVLVLIIFKGARKQIKETTAQNKKYMTDAAARTQKVLELSEESQKLSREHLQLARENNATLKQILEILKSRNWGGPFS